MSAGAKASIPSGYSLQSVSTPYGLWDGFTVGLCAAPSSSVENRYLAIIAAKAPNARSYNRLEPNITGRSVPCGER